MVPPGSTPVNRRRIPSPDVGEPPGTVVDRRRRGAHQDRARADGRRVDPGVSAAGTPLRRRARLLGDGLRGRDRAPERAHIRLFARLGRRTPTGDPDLRLGAACDGRGRADGRGRRRRHRRHELRLPGAKGDEDRRRRASDGESRARVPCRGSGHRGRARSGDGEDAARRRERLARLPRARAEARGVRRGGADAPSTFGAADVHGRGASMRSPPSSSRSWTCRSSRPGT